MPKVPDTMEKRPTDSMPLEMMRSILISWLRCESR